MRSALPFAPDAWRTPARRRAASMGLAVAAHALVFLMLWGVAPSPPELQVDDPPPTSFAIAPEPQAAPTPAARVRAGARTERTRDAAAPPVAAATDTPAPPATEPPPMLLLPGGMELFEAADIGRMRGRADEGDGEAQGSGDSVAPYGPGEGPGGQRLFNAEWHREPSRAELAGYLPSGAPPGSWALIACRTIEDYHVDNCRSLGEAPAGSGLARAMRQAAWQFRVRPPRVGGKVLIGAWVRIRFDFDKPGGTAGGTN